MVYVAVGELVGMCAIAIACFQAIDHLIRQQARERQLLTNQILHLSGHPWQPAPAEQPVPDVEPVVYLVSPDQAASPLN